MKILRAIIAFEIISFFCSHLVFGNSIQSNDSSESAQHMRKITSQFSLIDEGYRLMDRGLLDEAIAKFNEAMRLEYLNYPRDKALPLGNICAVLRFQNKYEESLKRFQWFIDFNPTGDGWVDQKRELDALLEAQKTRDPSKLYEHIRYLKEKHQKWLPPKRYHTFSASITSQIIRLYDHIGDQDGGIAFCDEMIEFCASGKSCSGNDAREYAYSMKNPYFIVRQAFEQDKAEGFKGCIDAKPGQACMGRATQALIQSDYFPW